MKRTRIYIKSRTKSLVLGFFLKNLIRKCCNEVLNVEKLNNKFEISVLLVDDYEIKILNEK